MSAPDTNVEKEEQKHKPALLGIKGAIGFRESKTVCSGGLDVRYSQTTDSGFGFNG